jgi:hypothetical protein
LIDSLTYFWSNEEIYETVELLAMKRFGMSLSEFLSAVSSREIKGNHDLLGLLSLAEKEE